MTTQEKILIGLLGLKELIAKKDVELTAKYLKRLKVTEEEFTEEHHELIDLKSLAEKLTDSLDLASKDFKL